MVTPEQAAWIMLFWSLGCGAIGYGIAVWRCNRAAKRREDARRQRAQDEALAALAERMPRNDGGYEGG